MKEISTEKNVGFDWKSIIISNGSTFLLTVIGSFIFYYFTTEKAKIVYEVFPPSSFISNKNKISIINVRVENTGNKEASEVLCYFKFNNGIILKEISTDFSNPGITFNANTDSLKNIVQYKFNNLNSSERCNFSFLLQSEADSLKASDIDVSIRAVGINGSKLSSNESKIAIDSDKENIIILALAGFFGFFSVVSFTVSLARNLNYLPSNKSKRKDLSDTLSTAVSYCDMGMFEESISLLKKMIYEYSNESSLHSNLARAYANIGKFEYAFHELQIGEDLIKNKDDKLIYYYVSAQVYCLNDDVANSLSFLSDAIQISRNIVVEKARIDDDFFKLKENTAFQSLIK